MKKIWKSFDITIIAFFAAAVCVCVTFFFNATLATVELALAVILFLAKVIYQKKKKDKLLYQVKAVAEKLDFETGKAFSSLSVSCCVIDKEGKIIWLNDSFMESFSLDKKTPLCNIRELCKKESIDKLLEGKGFRIKVDMRCFAVYSSLVSSDSEELYLLYFFDETKLRLTEREFYDTRPSVMFAVIDNSDELYHEFKESECTSIFSTIEQKVDDWATSYGALCRKYARGRLMIIVEERSLQKMIADKFNILENVRNFTFEGKQIDLVLSIGIGREESFFESDSSARLALDMAQSRGGDQVAIKRKADYSFYGGVSAGIEKRNKVKTRLIAITIAEIIKDCENVLIMGHRFSDYDSLGAAIGIYSIAKHFSKRTNIVVDTSTTLSLPLCKKFIEHQGEGVIISPEAALTFANDKTLLFVVDTHKRDFTECPELVDRAGKVIVIDHHRKSVGFIEDTVVFHHVPKASSACEIITEISQYVDSKPVLNPMEAQALFAGIVLDTRNFILRTGVRTFEAAAYLRSRGADTVEAKKLFSTGMEIFNRRNKIIDNARSYKDIFLYSTVEENYSDIRLISSQAADEMLNIDSVKASFVLYSINDCINISARSYGEVNVQLVMEALGGGGHQTMAAAQIKNKTLKEAKQMLFDAIDNYINSSTEVVK